MESEDGAVVFFGSGRGCDEVGEGAACVVGHLGEEGLGFGFGEGTHLE